MEFLKELYLYIELERVKNILKNQKDSISYNPGTNQDILDEMKETKEEISLYLSKIQPIIKTEIREWENTCARFLENLSITEYTTLLVAISIQIKQENTTDEPASKSMLTSQNINDNFHQKVLSKKVC